MKTTKFISVLSLALIFASATAVFAGIPEKPAPRDDNAIIRFQVNIHLSADLNISGTYLVQLVDAAGRLVAPPQPFAPGIRSYTFLYDVRPNGIFYERGWKTKITAMLTPALASEHIGLAELVTRPVTLVGPFATGHTYYFNLFPAMLLLQKEKSVDKVKQW
ncbi:MAG: hypothetical protein NT040_06880 [Bacteroidetes bacterium]|nr:hypothetical protein [Bacteroidota bacterium]